MTKSGLVNEVLRRLGTPPSRAAHGTYFKPFDGVACEVLCREDDTGRFFETVWSLRANDASANAARAEKVLRQLHATGRTDIHQRIDPVNRYIGLRTNVPDMPSSTFFDEVAKKAVWVRDHVDARSIW